MRHGRHSLGVHKFYLTTCCKERKVSDFRCLGKEVLDTLVKHPGMKIDD